MLRLLSLLLMVAGFVLGGYTATGLGRMDDADLWPTVEGSVTFVGDAEGRFGFNYPVVQYTYMLADVHYTSYNVDFTPVPEASNSALRYQIEDKVKVLYNPQNHSEAVLLPYELNGMRNMFLVAFGMIILGFIGRKAF